MSASSSGKPTFPPRTIIGVEATPAELRAALTKHLVAKEWVQVAKERLAGMLQAKRIASAKLERVGVEAPIEELDALFGEGNWIEHRGRIFWREDDYPIQRDAVVEILDRAEPKLNRSDPASTKAFTLYRINPNTIGVKEVPVPEVEKGTPIEPKALPAGVAADEGAP